MSRYRIETGRVNDGSWVPGPFHDAVNASGDREAVGAVRPTLAQRGFAEDWGDHARVLDAERREVARMALDRNFWSQ